MHSAIKTADQTKTTAARLSEVVITEVRGGPIVIGRELSPRKSVVMPKFVRKTAAIETSPAGRPNEPLLV